MASKTRILIVDDDPIVAESLSEMLSREGWDCANAYDADEALSVLADAKARPFQVILCDIALPTRSGFDLLRDVAKHHPSVAAIVLTGYGTVQSAVEALRLGAVDFLTKPIVNEDLSKALDRAKRHQALLEENTRLRTRLREPTGMDGIVGGDHRMQRVYEVIQAVAPSKTTVLMTGESGTGKSLVAGALHRMSPRANAPFVEISCGSIPETLLESELFGHAKGAFTGAHADKQGRFLAANSGTIFLDEINSASPGMQLKLLRVLQERKFEPVGSNETVEVDVRVVLASNQPLEDLVASGAFRQDLYYRINVVKVELPSLRERVGDIPHLAEHFLEMHAQELGRTITGFTDDAMDTLRRYPFPGNVRELANVVERAAVLARGQTIGVEDLPPQVIDPGGSSLASAPNLKLAGTAWHGESLADALLDPERRIILAALAASDWNRQHTADALGINRTTLYKKMKQLGIDGEERRAG
ncbi:MAG: sigma-54-dependent Fis family transcriptional regulator [Phycisphaeraceae bacterium]|nr:MAG: sigma-54-dependent Fis family transcriptional regulator [Phycisphaeraceae bacterium]